MGSVHLFSTRNDVALGFFRMRGKDHKEPAARVTSGVLWDLDLSVKICWNR